MAGGLPTLAIILTCEPNEIPDPSRNVLLQVAAFECTLVFWCLLYYDNARRRVQAVLRHRVDPTVSVKANFCVSSDGLQESFEKWRSGELFGKVWSMFVIAGQLFYHVKLANTENCGVAAQLQAAVVTILLLFGAAARGRISSTQSSFIYLLVNTFVVGVPVFDLILQDDHSCIGCKMQGEFGDTLPKICARSCVLHAYLWASYPVSRPFATLKLVLSIVGETLLVYLLFLRGASMDASAVVDEAKLHWGLLWIFLCITLMAALCFTIELIFYEDRMIRFFSHLVRGSPHYHRE